MIKYIILVMASLWLVGCGTHDERYYSLHPSALQQALKECPNKQPVNMSCGQLKNIASRVDELAYQLRLNPQGYGKEIITLQENIAKQEATLINQSNQPELQRALLDNKYDLDEHMAIVKWLESPGGS